MTFDTGDEGAPESNEFRHVTSGLLYAPDDDAEGKLVVAVLRQAARRLAYAELEGGP